jgi:hypothetical protein
MCSEIQILPFNIDRSEFADEMTFRRKILLVSLPSVGVIISDPTVFKFIYQPLAVFIRASPILKSRDLFALTVKAIPRPALIFFLLNK